MQQMPFSGLCKRIKLFCQLCTSLQTRHVLI